MTNVLVLIGRVTRDIELRKTKSGKSVANFTLAVNRDYQKDEVDWIRCVAWEKKAELLSQYSGKGRLICVSGAIETSSYEDSDGKRVDVTEVNVQNVQFLDSVRKSQSAAQGATQQGNQQFAGVINPSNGFSSTGTPAAQPFQSPVADPFSASGGDAGINVSSDDLPF